MPAKSKQHIQTRSRPPSDGIGTEKLTDPARALLEWLVETYGVSLRIMSNN